MRLDLIGKLRSEAALQVRMAWTVVTIVTVLTVFTVRTVLTVLTVFTVRTVLTVLTATVGKKYIGATIHIA